MDTAVFMLRRSKTKKQKSARSVRVSEMVHTATCLSSQNKASKGGFSRASQVIVCRQVSTCPNKQDTHIISFHIIPYPILRTSHTPSASASHQSALPCERLSGLSGLFACFQRLMCARHAQGSSERSANAPRSSCSSHHTRV